MTVALILIISIVTVGFVLWLLDRRRAVAPVEEKESPEPSPGADTEECCGMHITCEKDSLLAAVSKEIEYYDDEELDRFAGRAPEEYSDADTEEFRDVLITMRADDVAGWARSLQLRGIALPTPVRDELLMIVAEARAARLKPQANVSVSSI